MKRGKLLLAGLLAGGLLSAAVDAKPSPPPPPAGYCDGGSATGGLALTDMSFTVEGTAPQYQPVDCYGIVAADNDTVGDINAILDNGLKDWNDPSRLWQSLVRDNGTGGSKTYLGIEFTLDVVNFDPAGAWVLSWEDTNGISNANLPLGLDVVAVLKASNEWAAYLFEDIVFTDDPYSGEGTFVVKMSNKHGDAHALSHLTLYVRPGELVEPPIQPPTGGVPVPGTLALLGIGLIGIRRALMSRRA